MTKLDLLYWLLIVLAYFVGRYEANRKAKAVKAEYDYWSAPVVDHGSPERAFRDGGVL